MPESVRLADKSAALEAIRELHNCGELDGHLRPVSRDPDSDEDEDQDEEDRERQAGTERRAKYYPDEVCKSGCTCISTCTCTCIHVSIYMYTCIYIHVRVCKS